MLAAQKTLQLRIKAPLKAEYHDVLSMPALLFTQELCEQFAPSLEQLLSNRQIKQEKLNKGILPDFLPETANIRAENWKVAPIPSPLQHRCVEITGPASAKMIINALNAPVDVFMADFEDALSPTWANLVEGQIYLRDAIRGTLQYINEQGKVYKLNSKTAILITRPRGLHLPENHIERRTENGALPIPGCLLDFGLYCFHNAKMLLEKGAGPYFYIPKLENHLEARWWNGVFNYSEEKLGLPHGSIKATVLIETILAAFEMDEILYEMRDHIVGLNCGRWDYIFSFIKKFHKNPHKTLPDRQSVTMDQHFLESYCKLLIQTCHKRGALAMGGMSAFIPIKDSPKQNETALQKVREDKVREAHLGFDGTWIAHPGLAEVARSAFLDVMPHKNQLDRQLPNVNILAADLLKVPEGFITKQGISNNIKVAIQYIAAWLNGNGCVPLYNLMEDAATAEICRAQLWQWVYHQVIPKNSRQPLDNERFEALLKEGLTTIRKQIGNAQFAAGLFNEAAALLKEMTTKKTFTEFLTLLAYTKLKS